MSHTDPYADYPAGQAPNSQSQDAMDTSRGRSRSRSPAPARNGNGNGSSTYRSPTARGSPGGYRRRSPPPRKPNHAPTNPAPSNVLGVFGLSIRTAERDLEDEFGRFGPVDKVTIVYDQRTDRSRGFGFIVMANVDDAARCVQELNGVELNGRRIRVDYSVTERPHAPTPGEYMGLRRSDYGSRRDTRDNYRRDDRGGGGGGGGGSRYDRDRYDDRYDRRRGGGDDYRDREHRDRDWRRSPPARRYSPRRRSRSRSPRAAASPSRYEHNGEGPRW